MQDCHNLLFDKTKAKIKINAISEKYNKAEHNKTRCACMNFKNITLTKQARHKRPQIIYFRPHDSPGEGNLQKEVAKGKERAMK